MVGYRSRWDAVGLYRLNPVDPQLESAWFEHSSLSSEKLVSKYAFKFNLYPTTRVLANIAAALHYLHTRSPPVIHRDLKSANVLLTHSGDSINVVAKIADLGSAVLKKREYQNVPKFGHTATYTPPKVRLCIYHLPTCVRDVINQGYTGSFYSITISTVTQSCRAFRVNQFGRTRLYQEEIRTIKSKGSTLTIDETFDMYAIGVIAREVVTGEPPQNKNTDRRATTDRLVGEGGIDNMLGICRR